MKILTVIHRELLTRVRTKGFLVITFGFPLLLAAFGLFEYAIINASQHAAGTVAVVDLSQQVLPALETTAAAPAGPGAQLTLEPVTATAATLPAVQQHLRSEALDKKIDGYLVIPADVLSSRTAQYHTRNSAALAVNQELSQRLERAVNQTALLHAGVSAAQIKGLMGSFQLDELRITAQGDRSDNHASIVVPIALVIVLYLFLLIYGVVTMRAVTEEKTSRVSEVLLSAVDPFSLMMGKILGIAATGLTQFAVWGLCLALFAGYALTVAKAGGANLAQYLPHNAAALFLAVVIFFVLGYLLYASIYAAIGALVSSEQEAQQTQMPLSMLLVVAIWLAFLVMANPASPLSVVLSLIPFLAPILMVMRIAVSNPPLWQVLLSMALVAASFWSCTLLTAKIYRVGILMTGKRPNLAELRRWLKYS